MAVSTLQRQIVVLQKDLLELRRQVKDHHRRHVVTTANEDGEVKAQRLIVTGNTYYIDSAGNAVLKSVTADTISGTVSYSLPDGTVASPSLFFTADTDTGLYRVGADEIGVAVGGEQGFAVKRVGAGDLEVYIGASGWWWIGDTDTGMDRDGTGVIRITSDGNYVGSLYWEYITLAPPIVAQSTLAVTGAATFSTSVTTPYIDFPEGATPATPAADKIRLYAVEDADFSVLETITNLGIVNRINQDTFRVARNTSGVSIAKGQAVRFFGSTGNRPNFKLAQANLEANMPCIGMTTAAVANGAYGEIMIVGRLTGLKTDYLVADGHGTDWTEGDPLYVDPNNAGELTNVRPAHPNISQWVATIEKVHATTGILLVKIQALGGIESGTNLNQFTIGDAAAGDKVLRFDGVADATLTWTGTVCKFSHNIVIPDGGYVGCVTYPGAFSIADTGKVTFYSTVKLDGELASTLISTDANKGLTSVTALGTWILGTANQVTVTDNADGTVTLITPQNIHTAATPTFAGLTLGAGGLEINGGFSLIHAAYTYQSFYESTTRRWGMRINHNYNEMLLWSPAVGGNIYPTVLGAVDNNHDHGWQINPTLYIHSATAPDTNNTQWISFTHDATNGVIGLGTGALSIAHNVHISADSAYTKYGLTQDSGVCDTGATMLFNCDLLTAGGRSFTFKHGATTVLTIDAAGNTVVTGTLTVNGDQTGATDHVFDDHDDLALLENWRSGEPLPFEQGDILNRDRLLRDAIVQLAGRVRELEARLQTA